MRLFLAGLMALISAPLFAETANTIDIPANGYVRASNDYIALDVDVISRCYNSIQEASEANRITAEQAKKLMEPKKASRGEDQWNDIPETGDLVTEYGAYKNGNQEIICENKARMVRHLSVRLESPDTYIALKEDLIKLAPKTQAANQTYLKFFPAYGGLWIKTRRDLERQAIALAIPDAESKLDVFAGACGFTGLRLKHVAPANSGSSLPRAQSMRSAMNSVSSGSESSSPVLPEQVVTSDWIFTYEYTTLAGSVPCRRIATTQESKN